MVTIIQGVYVHASSRKDFDAHANIRGNLFQAYACLDIVRDLLSLTLILTGYSLSGKHRDADLGKHHDLTIQRPRAIMSRCLQCRFTRFVGLRLIFIVLQILNIW